LLEGAYGRIAADIEAQKLGHPKQSNTTRNFRKRPSPIAKQAMPRTPLATQPGVFQNFRYLKKS
jgi:hypothetical protein